MKKILSLAAPVFLALALSACGNRSGASIAAAQPESPDAAAEESEPGFPLALSNYGRVVTIPRRPQRVLTLGPNCAELFAALGLSDLVAGRSLLNHSRGPLPEYADAVNSMPVLNYGSATREAILSSGADFIYAIDWEIGEGNVSIEEAEQYGIAVYVNSASTVEEQFAEIRDIGKIFGIEGRAEEFIMDQAARLEAVASAIAGQEPVPVLVYDSGGSGIFTCSGSNFESILISLAGGRNVFGDLRDRQWVTVSYEEALARAPGVILIHDYDAPPVEEKILEIKSSPALSSLDCVKSGRFAAIELESVLPGSRIAHAAERMAAAFYPGIFAE